MKLAAPALLLSLSLFGPSLFGQDQPAPKPASKSALDKATLEAYLRYSELWIPQVTVKIDDPKPSSIEGFYDVGVHLLYNGATKDDMYYVSKDGKNIIKGTAYNIDESPFEANDKVLKTAGRPGYGAAEGAPVKLVVFSDFQCPYCQKEETDLRKDVPAAADLAGKVRVYFYDFPLTSIHPWAMKAAIAGRCLYHQSEAAFWNYHDWVYLNQKDITLENFDAKLQDWAKTQSLDPAKISACMNDKATAAEVEATMSLGHDLSVSATPTLFLNGRKLEGGVEWPVLQQLLKIEIEHKASEAKLAASAAPSKNASDESCCTVNIPILAGAAPKK